MEPCGASVPVSAYKTLVFMEHAAEVLRDLQLNGSDAIKNALEEINLRLESDNPKPGKQASHLLVAIVASLERKVMNTDSPRFSTAFPWYRLVKVWGA